MYRINLGLCILSSLVVAITSWKYCPSIVTYLILVAPQLAILGAIAGLCWILRRSRLAYIALLVPTLLVLWLAGSTMRYCLAAVSSPDQNAVYGLFIIIFWSWMAQVVVIGVMVGVIAVVLRKECTHELKNAGVLTIGLLFFPLLAFGLLTVVEEAIRAIAR
jgi:hypothetical protein